MKSVIKQTLLQIQMQNFEHFNHKVGAQTSTHSYEPVRAISSPSQFAKIIVLLGIHSEIFI